MNARKSIVVMVIAVTGLLQAGMAFAQRNLAVSPTQATEQRVALVRRHINYET
jgi:hypothetical protein